MPKETNKRRPQDLTRSVNYYAMLMGVVACVNFWIYWIQGSKLSLALGVVCLICLVVWLIVARRLLGGAG